MTALTSVVNPGQHQSVKLDPDPDSHQSEKQIRNRINIKVKRSLKGHFGALEGPNLGKSEW